MKKALQVGEKLFFEVLTICLLSSIYLKLVPITEITFFISVVISIIYFAINFYNGYKYELLIKESLIVGIMGCGVGIFLSFFGVYVQLILNNSQTALWIVMPYFMPTMPIIQPFINNLSIIHVFGLMSINILLVIFGAIMRKIMNKLRH